MWWIIPLIGIFIYLRYTQKLIFGLQIKHHIYGPAHNLYQESPFWFDLVLIGEYQGRIHLYRLIHSEYSIIRLTHVPVMHKLIYVEDGKEKEHSYFPGSPFTVRKGDLILSERKRKGLGFSLQEVARSKSWPMTTEDS